MSAANLLLFTVYSCLEIFEVHFNCARSLKLADTRGGFTRLRSRCGAVRILGFGGHSSRQVQGTPRVLAVSSRDLVAGAGDSVCRFRGRRSSLELVVVFGVL